MRVSYQPAAKWAPYMWLLVEPAHFVMGRRQLLGIQRRAEATLGDGRQAGLRDLSVRQVEGQDPLGRVAEAGSTRTSPSTPSYLPDPSVMATA
jgi:hypothetical protein